MRGETCGLSEDGLSQKCSAFDVILLRENQYLPRKASCVTTFSSEKIITPNTRSSLKIHYRTIVYGVVKTICRFEALIA